MCCGDIVGSHHKIYHFVATSCSDPGPVQNSRRTMNRPGASFTCGNTVTYTCNDGYEIQGEGTMTCGATGTWDNTRPLCVESKREIL